MYCTSVRYGVTAAAEELSKTTEIMATRTQYSHTWMEHEMKVAILISIVFGNMLAIKSLLHKL
jgi:hypothetical protein